MEPTVIAADIGSDTDSCGAELSARQDCMDSPADKNEHSEMLQGNATPSPVAAYIARWHQLIAKEEAADKAVVTERLANWPLSKLQQEGLVLLGLTATRRGKLYGAPLWVLQQPDRAALPLNKFTTGDEVLISKGAPGHSTTQPWKGMVVDRSTKEIRLTSKSQLPVDGTVLRLDKGMNTTVYKRMRTALKSLKKTPPNTQLLQQAAAAVTAAVDDPLFDAGAGSSEEIEDQIYEGDAVSNSWPLLISLQLEEKLQQKLQHERALRRKLARRETKRRRREQQCQQRHMKKVQQLRQPLHHLQQHQRNGTCLASVLVAPSAAAAIGPSKIMPAAAVDWAKVVLAQHALREQQQHGTQDSSTAAAAMQGLSERDPELGLNRSQVAAVANSIANKLSLIHGPPGTGKTTTTVALIAQLVKRWELRCPVLAVAQSHVGVDNLLEGLVGAGVKAVRLGQPFKIRESLRGATLEALLEAHPRGHEVEDTTQQQCGLRGTRKRRGEAAAAGCAARTDSTREELVADVLREAEVICATCAGAGSDMLAVASFPMVVLDEGSQASEPEALIPITRGAEHVVLVGDHCQLPPVCISEEAAAAGLAVSLFDRLMAAGVPSVMLQVQYRMHPGLSAFPNEAFYGSRLQDGISALQRPMPQPFPWPKPDMPIVFVDVFYGVEEVDGNGSKMNRAEADMVQQVLMHFLHVCHEQRSSLAVVVPYQAQLNLLNRQLASLIIGPKDSSGQQQQHYPPPHLLPPQDLQQKRIAGGMRVTAASSTSSTSAAFPQCSYATSSHAVNSSSSGAAADVLEIKTVDGYQGREREVVVFSAVRANPSSQVGFLEDWRRLNVAITRPRRGLVLIGHAATLAQGSQTWARYLAWLRQAGCVLSGAKMHKQIAAATAVAVRRSYQWVRPR